MKATKTTITSVASPAEWRQRKSLIQERFDFGIVYAVTRAREPPYPLHRTHRIQEFRVRPRLVEFLDEQFHRLHGRERREHLAQTPHTVELGLLQQQLFLARARLVDVDRRED